MKSSTRLSLLLRATTGFALASLGTGCATGISPITQTKARIQEKTTAFNQLTPQQQGNILGGTIERGNTVDMVYMALGKPTKIVTSADGHKAMWVYVEYYAANNVASTSANNPNSLNSEGMTMANNDRLRPFGFDASGHPAILDDSNWNVPSQVGVHPATGGAFMNPNTFSSTTNTGPMQSLSLPDLASNTVYVFFYYGKVAEIKLDGDDASQPKIQVTKSNKNGLKSMPVRKA